MINKEDGVTPRIAYHEEKKIIDACLDRVETDAKIKKD